MCRTHSDADIAGGGAGGPAKGRELLPANVIPRHYDLTLEPNFEDFTFKGHVVIDVDVVDDSKSISLHTLELEIQSAQVKTGEATIAFVAAAPSMQKSTC